MRPGTNSLRPRRARNLHSSQGTHIFHDTLRSHAIFSFSFWMRNTCAMVWAPHLLRTSSMMRILAQNGALRCSCRAQAQGGNGYDSVYQCCILFPGALSRFIPVSPYSVTSQFCSDSAQRHRTIGVAGHILMHDVRQENYT